PPAHRRAGADVGHLENADGSSPASGCGQDARSTRRYSARRAQAGPRRTFRCREGSLVNRVALKMLFGDPAKLLGLVFGMAFSTLLITQQASMFVGIMERTANLITETREPNIWVMDPAIEQIDAVRPLRDTELG